MRKKEWLVKEGFLPAGSENARGRLSLDNQARIAAAIKEGVTFEDGNAKTPTAPIAAVAPKAKDKPAGNAIVEPAAAFWPEGTKVFGIVDGKQVWGDITAAEQRCGYSLRWCACQTREAMIGSKSMRVYLVRP